MDTAEDMRPVPWWARDEELASRQVSPKVEYRRASDLRLQCCMTTEAGARCSFPGERIFEEGNPTLINFTVCRVHADEMDRAIGWHVYGGGGARPSWLARLVYRWEEMRIRDARRRVEETEAEIRAVVESRLNAPLYAPKEVRA